MPLAVDVLLGSVAVAAVAAAALAEWRRRRQARAADQQRVYAEVFDESLVGALLVRLVENDLVTDHANPAALELLGMPADAQPELTAALDPPAADDLLTACRRLAAGECTGWRSELRLARDEPAAWVEVTIAEVSNASAQEPSFTVQLVDTTVRREIEDRLTALALYDGLTGLPNRTLLTDRLRQRLRVAARDQDLVGLLLVDLDDFKSLNDAHGHAAGDAVLVEVARRLAAAVRPGDTVARFGGDEFVVLCPSLPDVDTASALAERLAAALEPPIEFERHSHTTSGSVGIAVGDSASSADALLRDADEAMYATKSMGRRRTTLFADDNRWRAVRTVQLEHALHAAVRNNELLLHVQPLVDLQTERIVAGETLVRWQHPERGLLLPGEWLDVAEQSALVHDVGRWVLRQSCHLGALWMQALGETAPAVHVNVSARQLERGDLCDLVADLLVELGLPADKLVLELTETELGDVGRSLVEELAALARRGVVLAADDFGTGYSPLARVTELPIQMLKIDRQLVRKLDSDQRADALVRAAVGIGHSLGLQVVAEGVETPAQAQAVAGLGCTAAQGYLWSPPRPPESFLTQVRAQRRRLPAPATPQPGRRTPGGSRAAS